MWPYRQTIGQVLEETSRCFPRRDAVAYLGRHRSYQQFNVETDRLAKGMLQFGIQRGTHVAVLSGNTPVALNCYFAIWKLGAVLIPVCTSCTTEELIRFLDVSDVEYLFFDDNLECGQIAVITERNVLKKEAFISIGTQPSSCIYLLSIYALGQNMTDAELLSAKQSVTPEDVDCLLFTSGSTGDAMPVVTTHFSRVNTMFAQADALDTTENDRFCAALPMCHCFSLTATILAAISAGACICFPEDFHTARVLDTIQRERCTIFNAVPTYFSAILAKDFIKDYDVSSLRTGMIGGSSYSPILFEKICRTLGMVLLPSLGQTESTAGITSGSPSDSLALRASTIGRFFPNIEGKFVNPETGALCPVNIVGEICIRGYNVMQGYYRRPEQTAQVVDRDGWLHTGDLGKMDERGYIHCCGRVKDIIIRGGENISPVELERVISAVPNVAQVKVIGVPDPHYIEEICACVVAESNAVVTPETVRDYVRRRLSGYKEPKYVLLLSSIPLNCSGKPDIFALRRVAISCISSSKTGVNE